MAKKNVTFSIPSWLGEVKEDATKTAEWNELSRHIYEAVDQHLSQSHVSYFTDLTEAEKNLLLERAARSLASSDGGHVYENLQSKLSYLLDQSVNNLVAKKMLEDYPLDTKTDLVLDATSEGIVTLLRKHPDQKYKLRVFLNQVIPQPIRFLGWQLFFSNNTYRKIFINKLSTNPKLCLSTQDIEIQRRCESIINTAITFKEMKDSKGNLNSIKGVLSYYHTTLNNKRSLTESEFLYSLAIVNTHHPSLPKNDSPTERSMAMLIEIYQQFIQTLPSAILQSLNGYDDNPEMDMLVKSVISILDEFDPHLLDYIKELARKSSTPGIEDITFQTAFKSICTPMIRNLFAGYLELNPLMYVWDQYMITIDVPGFHDELIPVFVSIIIMILRDQIMSVKNIGEFDEFLINQSIFIQTRQLQTVFNKYFFKNLQAKLNTSSRLGPVIDPTIGRLQPWEHWHQDVVPRRNQKPREPDDNDAKLKAEINKRLLAEKKAKEEIDKLRRELDVLKKRPAAVVPRPQPQPQPSQPQQPPKKNEPLSKDPLLDAFAKIQSSINKIGQGEGRVKEDLDRATAEDLKLHKLDLKIAEKQVFGHQLGPNEWDRLNDRDKKIKSEQMLAIVKQRMAKRFNENNK